MGLAMQRLAEEDPTFRIHVDEKLARPSSQAWANSIWTFSLTV